MLAITRNGQFYGIVGTESNTEVDGVNICLGDTVHVAEDSYNNEFKNVVLIFGNKIGAMGLGSSPLSKLNILKITNSHKDLKAGDKVYNGFFDVEEFKF